MLAFEGVEIKCDFEKRKKKNSFTDSEFHSIDLELTLVMGSGTRKPEGKPQLFWYPT